MPRKKRTTPAVKPVEEVKVEEVTSVQEPVQETPEVKEPVKRKAVKAVTIKEEYPEDERLDSAPEENADYHGGTFKIHPEVDKASFPYLTKVELTVAIDSSTRRGWGSLMRNAVYQSHAVLGPAWIVNYVSHNSMSIAGSFRFADKRAADWLIDYANKMDPKY